jgi:1-acyl-sn-glycerol-3-phosphate acyltransferase
VTQTPKHETAVQFDLATARPAPWRGLRAEIARGLCALALRLGGWRMRGDWPKGLQRCVLLAAPHTSNWDGFWMLAAAGFYRVKLRWMGKRALVAHPFGFVLRWAGVVPVDRGASQDMVRQMQAAFAAEPWLVLAISPEGTREPTPQWKRGFYHIARGASVPIVISVLDYGRHDPCQRRRCFRLCFYPRAVRGRFWIAPGEVHPGSGSGGLSRPHFADTQSGSCAVYFSRRLPNAGGARPGASLRRLVTGLPFWPDVPAQALPVFLLVQSAFSSLGASTCADGTHDALTHAH